MKVNKLVFFSFITLIKGGTYLYLVFALYKNLNDNPINIPKLKLVMGNIFSNIEFNELVDFFYEINNLVIILLMFSVLNFLSALCIPELLNEKYILIAFEKLNPLKKHKYILISFISLIFFIILLNPIQEIVLLIFFYIAFILWCLNKIKKIIFIIKSLLLNKNIKYWFKKIKSNSTTIATFLFSLYISVRQIFRHPIEIKYFPLFILTVYFSLFILEIIFKSIKKLLLSEYHFAKIHKRFAINNYVIEELFKNYESNISKNLKNKLESIILFENFSLNNRIDFLRLLDKAQFRSEIISELTSSYDGMIIEYYKTSKLQAKIIKDRNIYNLCLSLFLFSTVFILFYFPKIDLFEYNKYFALKIFFSIVFYKLVVRSIEIAIAFYNDIRPEEKTKNTNLSNNERMSLVLKSIAEVIVLAGTLYTLINIFILNDFVKIENILLSSFNGITHSIATAAFNTSFPYDFLAEFKIEKDEKKYEIIKIFSWFTVVQIIHIIQLIMSIILISLSITSYGSKNSESTIYIFRRKKNNYQLLECDRDGNYEVVMYEFDRICELIKVINKDKNEKKITLLQYSKIRESLKSHLLKK